MLAESSLLQSDKKGLFLLCKIKGFYGFYRKRKIDPEFISGFSLRKNSR